MTSGAAVKLHICGDTTHLLESLRELESDIIDLDWQVDLDLARKILGNDIVIGGNINPVLVQDKSAGRSLCSLQAPCGQL